MNNIYNVLFFETSKHTIPYKSRYVLAPTYSRALEIATQSLLDASIPRKIDIEHITITLVAKHNQILVVAQ